MIDLKKKNEGWVSVLCFTSAVVCSDSMTATVGQIGSVLTWKDVPFDLLGGCQSEDSLCIKLL